MKRKKRSWIQRLVRKRKLGSKSNWFRKAKKSDAKSKPLWMVDPASLPANVANRNLNPNSDGINHTEIRSSHQQATPARTTGKPPKKRGRSKNRMKKVWESFRKILIKPGEFNIWISIYSLGLFILAYLFINFIYQFSTIVTASFFNIDAVLYYYEVYFPIGNASNLWSAANIIAITVAGPLVSALVSVLFFRILRYRKSLSPWLSVFLYWAALHAAAHFLGAFVGGVVTQEGMGYVVGWLFMNVFFKILFSLTFLFLLSLIGYYAKSIPRINYISELPRSEKRLSNSLSIDIIPWFLGTLLLLLFKIPDKIPQHELIRVYDSIILASMLFAIAAKAFSNKRPRISQRFRFATIKNQDGLGILAIALIMIVFMRYVLTDGIHFIINISFSAGFYR